MSNIKNLIEFITNHILDMDILNKITELNIPSEEKLTDSFKIYPQLVSIIYLVLIKLIRKGDLEVFQKIFILIGDDWINTPLLKENCNTEKIISIYLLDEAIEQNQLTIANWLITKNESGVFLKNRHLYRKWCLINCLFKLKRSELVGKMLTDNVIQFDMDENESGMKSVHFAYSFGSIEMLEWFLSKKLDVNLPVRGLTKLRMHPLHLAAINNHVPLFEFYKAHNWLFDVCDSKGFYPIHYAILYSADDVLAWLLENSYSTLAAPSIGKLTPLHLSICTGNLAALEALTTLLKPSLLQFMIDDNYCAINFLIGIGIIHTMAMMLGIIAEYHGRPDLVDKKIKKLPTFDLPLSLQKLMMEANHLIFENALLTESLVTEKVFRVLVRQHFWPIDNQKIVIYLLKYLDSNFSLNKLFRNQNLVVKNLPHHAAAFDNTQFLKLLFSYFSNNEVLNYPDAQGSHPIHYAAQYKATSTLSYLLEIGIDSDQLTKKHDYTPLTIAAALDNLEITEIILLHSPQTKQQLVPFRTQDSSGSSLISWRTALAEAISNEKKKVFDFLLSSYDLTKHIAYQNGASYYAIHYAAGNFSLEKFKQLLSYDESLEYWEQPNGLCHTPTTLALSYNSQNILNFLIENNHSVNSRIQKFFPDYNILTSPTRIGWLPFHYLCYIHIPKDTKIINLSLISKFLNNCNLNLPTENGLYLVQLIFNFLDFSDIGYKINNFIKFFSLLLRHGMMPNIKNIEGDLPYKNFLEKIINDPTKTELLIAIYYCFYENGHQLIINEELDFFTLSDNLQKIILEYFPYSTIIKKAFNRGKFLEACLANLDATVENNDRTINIQKFLINGGLISQTLEFETFVKIKNLLPATPKLVYLSIGLTVISKEEVFELPSNFIFSHLQFKDYIKNNPLIQENIEQLITTNIVYLGYLSDLLALKTQQELLNILFLLCETYNNGTLLKKIEKIIDNFDTQSENHLINQFKKLYFNLYLKIHKAPPTLVELSIKTAYEHYHYLDNDEYSFFKTATQEAAFSFPLFSRYQHRILQKIHIKEDNSESIKLVL